jgi:predicted HD phosphohydrolase
VSTARRLAKRGLRRLGYQLRRIDAAPEDHFSSDASAILRRHDSQSLDDVFELGATYASPVLGEIRIFDLFPILARCIDPTDRRLGSTSQLTHTLQVVEGMQSDGVSDRDLLIAALVHDLGKTLLTLTSEDPANVVGLNRPIGDNAEGVGFDNCVFQWNHDEFAYQRFRDHVSEPVAWLVRYHSARLDLPEVQRLMDDRDRLFFERYYTTFRHYDFDSKSTLTVPRTQIEEYAELLDDVFPQPIPF